MPYFYSWVGQTTGGSGSADKISRGFITNNMEPNHEQTQEEIYRLVKENNKMLHGMRRNAFLGGVFKVIFWIALIVAPIWFYQIYLSPVVDSMLQSINQIGGASATAQSQFTELQNALKKFQSQIPTVFQPK